MILSVESRKQLLTAVCVMKFLSDMANKSKDLADFADCFQKHLFEILSDETQHMDESPFNALYRPPPNPTLCTVQHTYTADRQDLQ